MSLKNKVAIVTGGATMIGEGVVAALVAEGCQVVIADIDTTKGPQVAQRHAGSRFIATDVSDDASIAACVAETVTAGRPSYGMELEVKPGARRTLVVTFREPAGIGGEPVLPLQPMVKRPAATADIAACGVAS